MAATGHAKFSINAQCRPYPLPRLPLRSSKAPTFFITLCSSATRENPTSPPSPLAPPATREEAISQARTCLAAALQKPLNNVAPLGASRKVRRQRQARFRVEIPIIDDGGGSPGSSLVRLAFDLFSGIEISRKGATPTLLLLWPSTALLELAVGSEVFEPAQTVMIKNSALGASGSKLMLSSCDVVVFLGSGEKQLEKLRAAADESYPRPAVLFNPTWAFEDETGFDAGARAFVGSFDVVYAFMGLEVRGVLSRRKGVVFRCAGGSSGVSGESWVVMVEEQGELKEVSRFRQRPSIGEVEAVLYNMMAVNSPLTKSVRFLKGLVAGATASLAVNKTKQKQ